MSNVQIIDSHTEGEPTRVVISGGPELGDGPLGQRRDRFQREFDTFRSGVVNEPRGADHIVGALLCEPNDSTCTAGVIFFNNAGYLQMCGHGTIGLVVTLAHLKRISPGTHRIETPVGVVTAQLQPGNRVSVANVPAYRFRQNVPVEVEGIGTLYGDIAWGGNWFFLISRHDQELNVSRARELTDFTTRVKDALETAGIAGKDGAPIDHIELFGPPTHPDNHSRNFVLCPGGAYDRSPCGTGTSAKMACLYADGKLQAGQAWFQESILGTRFEGSVEVTAALEPGTVLPTITGTAFVTGETQLVFDPADPLRSGVRS